MKRENKKKGFTLVELLVVIAILAILATVSIVGYTAFINRAHQSNAETEAHQIKTLLDAELLSGNEVVYGDYTINLVANDTITITTVDAENNNTIVDADKVDGLLAAIPGCEDLEGKLSISDGSLVYTYSKGTSDIVVTIYTVQSISSGN